MRATRFLRIVHTIGRYRLDEFAPRRGAGGLRLFFGTFYAACDRASPRAVRLRLALESLGPIFVKFGQLLSVRPDLVPEDIALELARLQDNVPPFPWTEVAATLDRAYGVPHAQRFASIERALAAQGKRPQDATLAEMDALWDAAKDEEKGRGA